MSAVKPLVEQTKQPAKPGRRVPRGHDGMRVVVRRVSCLRCGTSNDSDNSVCSRCGAKLKGSKVENKSEKKAARFGPSVSHPNHQGGPLVTGDFPVNRIYRGDCLEVLRMIPERSVDLIVTSPPYNFGLDDYDTHHDTHSWDAYFSRLSEVFAECHRVLKSGGRICVVVQPLFSDYVPTHHIVSQYLRNLGYLFKAEIVWEKHNWNCKYTAWGSWKSPSMLDIERDLWQCALGGAV